MVIVEQRFLALELANQTRLAGRELRERLRVLPRREGYAEVARLLCDEPETIGALPVHKLLEAIPRVGPEKVRRLLVKQRVWPLRRVRELTARQREVLAVALVAESERLEWLGGWR